MLLASTPLLFKGIISRSEPWFGSFAIEHLSELTLDDGVELLRRLAVEDGDDAVASYVLEPRGRARLEALHHLAGGSPRLWMILAGCASVGLLDDLVPAVEELLENLVTYYQQRLWELPGNEQKLIRELGTGPPSTSVADLARRCGLDERTAATALGRLAEAGWVHSEKVAGTDQRRSWYRLREPLLRHHFQYRQAGGEPLRLVVDRLLGEVRCWVSDPDAVGSPEAGMLLEAAALAVKESPAAARAVLDALTAAIDDDNAVPAHPAGHLLRRMLVEELVAAGRLQEAAVHAVAAVDRAAADVGNDDDLTWKAVESLFVPLLALLRRGGTIPSVEPVTSSVARKVLGLVREMEAARDGRPEGRALLPSELRSLVDQLRAEGQNTSALVPSGATR